MSKRDTLYIPLLNEGIDCWRPTLGEHIGGMRYKISATKNYDPDSEDWEFKPGTIVECRREIHDGTEVLVPYQSVKEEGNPEILVCPNRGKSEIILNKRYQVCYRVISNTLLSAQITGLLGIQPDRTQDIGDSIPNQANRKQSQTLWLINSHLPKSETLDVHIENIYRQLEDRQEAIAKLLEDGCYTGISCGVFYYESQHNLQLLPETLQHIATLGCDVSISCYDIPVDEK